MTIFDDVAATIELGSPSARKGGRDPRWPYVPVIVYAGTPESPKGYTGQVRGLAYATRDEAVDAAERSIVATRASLARKLADPRHRALREQYGLPRELDDVEG